MTRWQDTIDAYERELVEARRERDTLKQELADAHDRLAQVSTVLSVLSLTIANGTPIPGIPRHDDAEVLRQLRAVYESQRVRNGSES